MDAIRERLNQPAIAAAVGLVVGLIVGLVVLGWWLFPVQYTDAFPEHLRAEFKEEYLRMAIDSFAQNTDIQTARRRYSALGEDAPQILATVAANPAGQGAAQISQFRAAVRADAPETGEPGAATPGFSLRSALLVMCGLTLVLAVALAAVFVIRRQQQIGGALSEGGEGEFMEEAGQPVLEGEEPPLAQFMTTYMLGDDLFDDSFSIDSPVGEFLGECGVGIAETIGVGEPKRVSSFEVWLFDKNDIQTVTKVLMSSHAYSDDTTRQRLAAKGEPVLAEPGTQLVLETATLQLVARVVDMSYGEGALPDQSFFERVTLELAVWPKT